MSDRPTDTSPETPSAQVEVNEVGDVVVREAGVLRLLADGRSLKVLQQLQRHGAASGADVAAAVALSPVDVAESLRALEQAGLAVRTADSGQVWQGVGKGLFFEIPADGDGAVAGRELATSMLWENAELPRAWIRDVEPALPNGWARSAGMFNANITMTSAELDELQVNLERLLEPLTNRDPGDVPADARQVRVLAFFLPGPDA